MPILWNKMCQEFCRDSDLKDVTMRRRKSIKLFLQIFVVVNDDWLLITDIKDIAFAEGEVFANLFLIELAF